MLEEIDAASEKAAGNAAMADKELQDAFRGYETV